MVGKDNPTQVRLFADIKFWHHIHQFDQPFPLNQGPFYDPIILLRGDTAGRVNNCPARTASGDGALEKGQLPRPEPPAGGGGPCAQGLTAIGKYVPLAPAGRVAENVAEGSVLLASSAEGRAVRARDGHGSAKEEGGRHVRVQRPAQAGPPRSRGFVRHQANSGPRAGERGGRNDVPIGLGRGRPEQGLDQGERLPSGGGAHVQNRRTMTVRSDTPLCGHRAASQQSENGQKRGWVETVVVQETPARPLPRTDAVISVLKYPRRERQTGGPRVRPVSDDRPRPRQFLDRRRGRSAARLAAEAQFSQQTIRRGIAQVGYCRRPFSGSSDRFFFPLERERVRERRRSGRSQEGRAEPAVGSGSRRRTCPHPGPSIAVDAGELSMERDRGLSRPPSRPLLRFQGVRARPLPPGGRGRAGGGPLRQVR